MYLAWRLVFKYERDSSTFISLERYRAIITSFMAKTLLSHNAIGKIGASCGLLTFVFLFVGFPGAGFLPLPSPSLSADEIAAHYTSHQFAIKAMGTLISIVGITYTFFTATLAGQLARIPGVPRAVIYTQLVGGCFTGLYVTLPGYILLVTAYRPERPPEITFIFNDMFWMLLNLNVPAFIAQDFAFSYAILHDHRPRPLFPHWLAYLSTASTLFYWPALAIPFVYRGVATWNGALSFWVPGVIGALNLGSISLYLFKAIGRNDIPGDGEIREG
jgi:hypothetical protein